MSLDALHTPSSAASQAPTQPSPADGDGPVTVQSELKRLTEVRKGVEAQLDVYFSVLSSNNCTMDTPLVDREGFPRSDIDVASVRTARMWIHRLRNDLKAVMGELEGVVHRGLPRGEDGEGEGETEDAVMEEQEGEKAWARVDAVAPGSPADTAGLKRDDLVLSLSSITSANNDNLRAVAALVGRSEGVELELVVRRGAEKVKLRLTPSKWSGRGLLGCHIVPYASTSS
ncbi:hypothetical protein JCM6882_001350 [Rhodosporidiobolus microsporus]